MVWILWIQRTKLGTTAVEVVHLQFITVVYQAQENNLCHKYFICYSEIPPDDHLSINDTKPEAPCYKLGSYLLTTSAVQHYMYCYTVKWGSRALGY